MSQPVSMDNSLGLRSRQAGLIAGPLVAILMQLFPAPEGLSQPGWATAAVAVLMAIWWMSEAVPLAATALVPLVLFPLLGIGEIESAAQSYANPLIFLFLGGFILAKGLERWQLHRRLAMKVLGFVGQKPAAIIAGIMAITAFFSMWVSNTATTMVMLPIGLSIVATLSERAGDRRTELLDNFAPALMLAIAFSATIGGMGTLIGTPPNALFAGLLQSSYGITIGFAKWMLVGVPAVLLLLPVAWLILTRIVFRIDTSEYISGADGASMGMEADFKPMTRPEYTVAGVMVMVALGWLLRPLLFDLAPGLPLSDAGIAMTGALALFLIPAQWTKGNFLLGWQDLAGLRWDVLILFGGGLTLAGAIGDTGLAAWIGTGMQALSALPTSLLILAVMIVIVYLGELASNTAMAAVFLPVAGAAALGMGADPLALMLPVALAASLGFMLPVATPPNAIIFGSGAVTGAQMLRAGALLNIAGIIVVFAIAMTIGRWVFGG